ncbi:hypothetical protein [Aequorivita echinoideorum]|uniref:Uncharacterized protein n=1 Tax=Aequorivita echinoideorum TaxID=1549647 RepID=A0ABS5S7B0_9FLAO|nr:hypothetical protein [Aequorivita echinoideorum]MBT0608868.1 hypothetical protein [Aequorivita echinoideorum]
MAEIKIEKKKPVWPWILLVLLILVGVYFFWNYQDTMDDREQNEVENNSIEQMDENYDTPVEDSTTQY